MQRAHLIDSQHMPLGLDLSMASLTDDTLSPEDAYAHRLDFRHKILTAMSVAEVSGFSALKAGLLELLRDVEAELNADQRHVA